MEKSKRKNIVLVVLLALLVVACVLVPLTSAWFTDSTGKSEKTLTFGEVSVDADLDNAPSSSVVLTPNELLPGNDGATRTLTIKNTGTVPCYARFSVAIKIDGKATDKINLTEPNGTAKQTDGKYFVCANNSGTAIASSLTKTISLKFTVDNDFGNAYKNKSVTVTVVVEATQVANNGTTYSTIKWTN